MKNDANTYVVSNDNFIRLDHGRIKLWRCSNLQVSRWWWKRSRNQCIDECEYGKAQADLGAWNRCNDEGFIMIFSNVSWNIFFIVSTLRLSSLFLFERWGLEILCLCCEYFDCKWWSWRLIQSWGLLVFVLTDVNCLHLRLTNLLFTILQLIHDLKQTISVSLWTNSWIIQTAKITTHNSTRTPTHLFKNTYVTY